MELRTNPCNWLSAELSGEYIRNFVKGASSVRTSSLKLSGKIDILINVAGGNVPGATVMPDQNFWDMKLEDWDKVLNLNLNGTVYPCHAFSRIFAKQGYGCILNISSMAAYEALREQIGDGKVLLALSGGVDSSVVAALLIKAVGKQLVSVHVNHGLLRKGEPEQVVRVFRDELDANLVYVDATDRFLDKLAGVADPEQKRKIIGGEFIRVFEEEARKLQGVRFLAQGTIYPDIVESGPVKSHHNVGGLPEDLNFELVELFLS